MKVLRWSHEKNELLKQTRGVSFEEVVHHIENDDVLDVRKHPNQESYAHQRIFVIEHADYVYLVPFVENDEEIFLKTIIPSRKAKKEFRDG
ncbi:MAG: BrnT family toxin [bacterium]|nr:BrnT family toxin [bacterium]